MKDWSLSVADVDFGGLATWSALICALSAGVVGACNRRWPEIGELVTVMLAATGTVSGMKIVILTMMIEPIRLGALAEDKAALVVGGAVTTILSLREGVAK
jgi:hypothetical protein